MIATRTLASTLLVALAAGCTMQNKPLELTGDRQTELRTVQSRVYDATDTRRMLRAVMATLQDLGFVIDNANDAIGTVSATKLDKYRLRMTVSVRQRGTTQLLVRANAQYNLLAVEDADLYQQFFDALSGSVSLAAQPLH